MRVDLIELLRCPNVHAPAPLVTVAYARDGDQLLEGSLGCPVCHASFALRHGTVYLGPQLPIAHHIAHHIAHRNADQHAEQLAEHAREVLGDRFAALLNLAEPRMRVALCGHYAEAASQLEKRTDALCVALNAKAPDQLCFTPTPRIPLANDALRAIAVDHAHQAMLADVTRVVRIGGRVVAPVEFAVPVGCRELARDATEWVAQVTHAPSESSRPVALRRGSAYG